MEKPIIVLTGPTASGKTAMSFELAKKFSAEIICADSMTVYRGLDIGTDKPTLNSSSKRVGDHFEIQGVTHHLIDILNPDQDFNVAIFKEKVSRLVDEIQARGKVPILVGGSLLYIDSYIYDFQLPKVEPDEKLRAELDQKSNEELFADLVALDPDAEWTVDAGNKRRLIRALEVSIKSGQPFTAQKTKQVMPKNVLYLAVSREREALYDRINHRVDQMMHEGFLAEVEKLHQKYGQATALQATGYRQLIQYLNGEITKDEAVEQTKKSHRNFAKRQLTWLRANPDVNYINTAQEAESKIAIFLKSENF